MIRAERLATAPVPGSDSVLELLRRPLKQTDEYTIRLAGGIELMNSRRHGSEDALGAMACEHIRGTVAPRVLIGGLGMGFTLAAALAHLPPDAEVTVAELVAGVIDWNRGWLGPCAGHPLADARATVVAADVGDLIRDSRDTYDAIVLDVDNGPEALTHPSNADLYSALGLSAAQRALRQGGALLIWSSSPDRAFTRRLAKVGFDVHEERVRAHQRKGTRHIIWVARA